MVGADHATGVGIAHGHTHWGYNGSLRADKHAYPGDFMSVQSKTRPGLRKLTDQQVIEIRRRAKDGGNKSQMCRDYQVGLGTIEAVIKWETYRDVFPDKWEG